MSCDCEVYRCARQADMYLYLRADSKPEDLPEALLKLTGKLTRVMSLQLTPQRKLARVDVTKVIEKIASDGYYLQMPPKGHLDPHLYFGD